MLKKKIYIYICGARPIFVSTQLIAPAKIINLLFQISDFRFLKIINFIISDMTMVNDKVVGLVVSRTAG